MKSCIYLIPSLMLLIGVMSIDPPAAFAEKTASAPVAASKKTNARTVISVDGIKFSLQAPAGFTMSKEQTSEGPVFGLSDPRKDKKVGGFITISVVKSDGKLVQKEFMNGVLEGYKEELKSFKKDNGPTISINGIKFENCAFSGKYKGGTESVGDIYCTVRDSSYIVFVVTANGPDALNGLAPLTEAVRTFRYEKK